MKVNVLEIYERPVELDFELQPREIGLRDDEDVTFSAPITGLPETRIESERAERASHLHDIFGTARPVQSVVGARLPSPRTFRRGLNGHI